MENQLFKVMESAGGYSEIHTEWLTLDEADVLRLELADTFTESDFWIQHHTEQELDEYRNQENRIYNNNAVDGWEDMFPHYED
jgi:hypothetical protein